MARQIGIWIDHRKAVVVDAATSLIRTLHSEIAPHTRFVGSGGHPAGQSAQRGGSERRYEARAAHERHAFYDEVLSAAGSDASLYVFGPGEAAGELAAHLASRSRPAPTVTVGRADEMTDPQIRDAVLEFFHGPHRP